MIIQKAFRKYNAKYKKSELYQMTHHGKKQLVDIAQSYRLVDLYKIQQIKPENVLNLID